MLESTDLAYTFNPSFELHYTPEDKKKTVCHNQMGGGGVVNFPVTQLLIGYDWLRACSPYD